ncbi:hypothetical protein A3H10_03355 [Candidatus Uhrbacteria bacterium RIFCSPLOWO2_12_FULL_46_10]|uniref:Glycosyltransferase RgtA/B/C/D-like domain-containing protein n=1 Tax=Candidatus Uhrbacteria bacterium RIFCSPLOWO2_01_FULL_47_25 TaxID=1802402 RepID=A0A1F7URB2_9BACT|nr:MAG: hypothetical protein A2752_00655 [Candidatus Uhrbacteria bacterium RIFCSPHIGHO2_01_FULL_46_23]OGL69201.1 MAG: hypothetical protein A3D60_04860 [Candidatus Uhrbacteria bacterium RIFCSPHIGHO2_02_FULL_47_29]OGL75298.1 MAG: hypothetical protein A3E96_01350 [Candidatus Uhrbacteria bacterium RIFCSPHIGHO2_12_FULL_46_13]OGL80264.1 MAG: hypothetical protein A2936_02765 [Candidatus Uhrbacteria bacterium RIFCSPLOWO2_01_FULL_47_25]OGL85339.1 MAG: hypothetical protein A3I37_00670 [Candidatus Uhrbact
MYITFVFLALGLSGFIAINHFFWQSAILGAVLGSCYLVGGGWYLGKQIISTQSIIIKTIAGALLWVAFLAGFSGLVYRLWNLESITVMVIIALAPLIVISLASLKPAPLTAPSRPDNDSITQEIPAPESDPHSTLNGPSAWINYFLIIAVVAILTITVALLFISQTNEALRSPWTIVPPAFFPLIFLANLLALAFGFGAIIKRSSSNHWIILVLLTAISLIVAVIIYEVGYGFDPFVHQATELLIKKNGIVLPRQWYYLGQYGLVVSLSYIFQNNVIFLDKLLLPVIAAITLPTILFLSLSKLSNDCKVVFLSSLALLTIPLRWFINTTPQGLGNLALLAIIFIGFAWPSDERRNIKWLLWGLAFVAATIHPLAGLPAIIFLTLSAILKERRAYSRYLTAVLPVVLGAIIPLLFWIQERKNLNAIPDIISVFNQGVVPMFSGWIYFEQRFNLILDAVYHFEFNLPIIILVLAAIGIILSYRPKQLRVAWPHLLTAAILAIDGLILNNFLSFRYLIDYERTWYGNRLWEMAMFFLLPYAALALIAFFNKLLKASPMVIIFWALVLATLRTASVYLTYPRFDGYAYDRGYSPSVHDIKAVRAIENKAKEPYIVLANQATSAAALRELGFKKYFTRRDAESAEQIFFYPIPTGGSLYQYYLKMVYEEPSRKNVEVAMNMVGVKEAYFVLNDYWTDSQKIAVSAKQEADSWEIIDGGKIYIFKYQRSNSTSD